MKKETFDELKPHLISGCIVIAAQFFNIFGGWKMGSLSFYIAMGLPATWFSWDKIKSSSGEVALLWFLLMQFLIGPLMAMVSALIIIPLVIPYIFIRGLLTGKPFIEPEAPRRPGDRKVRCSSCGSEIWASDAGAWVDPVTFLDGGPPHIFQTPDDLTRLGGLEPRCESCTSQWPV